MGHDCGLIIKSIALLLVSAAIAETSVSVFQETSPEKPMTATLFFTSENNEASLSFTNNSINYLVKTVSNAEFRLHSAFLWKNNNRFGSSYINEVLSGNELTKITITDGLYIPVGSNAPPIMA